MTKVELFEHIRKDYYLAKESKRGIATKHKIHRRTVRQAISDPNPPVRAVAKSQAIVLTPEIKVVIDKWLLSDRKAPRKQRHTAQRIFTRLVEEYRFTGKLPTVKRHVGERRRELGLKQEGFVPLSYDPGIEAEVDWYEAYVNFPWGQRKKVYIFQMRACFSGKEFHMAFPRCTQQAFLEAHAHAFLYFGGAFKVIRYDNLKSAVNKVLRGRKRIESDKFVLLRSHYLFDAVFCKPGKSGAHEKGGVECAVGRFRRQHLVPVPNFKDYHELNRYLLKACQKDDERKVTGKMTVISADWQQERNKLLPLPKQAFDYTETITAHVNSRSLITLKTNRYSVPTTLINQRITIKLSSNQVSCYFQGQCVAQHELCHKPYEVKTNLDHYLELLWAKPGALANALPLKQARIKNQWESCYDDFWVQLIDRYGQFEGTRQLIDILFLHRQYPAFKIRQAIESSSKLGWYSLDSVRQLLSPSCPAPKDFFQSHHHLTGFNRAPSQSQVYNVLLSKGEVV